MAYAKRFPGGFVDLPSQTTDIDSQFLNAVEGSLLRLDSVDPSADGQVLSWLAANSRYGPALLLNKNIDPNAAIDKSKLNLAGQITNADISGSAPIQRSKLDFGVGLVDADIAPGAAIQPTKVVGTVPPGGGTGQALVKSSAADYAMGWSTLGNPGTTNQVDYAQIITPSAAVAATTEATSVAIITGASVVYDGTTRAKIEFFAPFATPSTTLVATYVLYRDATVIGMAKVSHYATGPTAMPVTASVFDTPAAGAHTYSVKAYVSTGTVTVQAGPGGSGQYTPAYLRVTRDPIVGPTGPAGPQGPPGAATASAVTNVSQLPASPSAGQIAFLQLTGEGVIPLVYDGSISKWTSPPFRAWTMGLNGSTLFSWGSSAVTDADALTNCWWLQRIVQPFRLWDTAGLKLQHRTRGLIKTAANTNAVIYVSYATAALNGGLSAYTRFTTGGISAGSGQSSFRVADSGWVDPSTYPTVADYIYPSFQYTSTGGISGPAAYSCYCDFRWVA